jgi:hypothetical protein
MLSIQAGPMAFGLKKWESERCDVVLCRDTTGFARFGALSKATITLGKFHLVKSVGKADFAECFFQALGKV